MNVDSIEPRPVVRDIAWEDAGHTLAAATVDGTRWSGIADGSRHWPAVRAALAAGARAAPYPAEAAARAAERARIEARLAALDGFGVRPLRAREAGTATWRDDVILEALEREAVELRGRLEAVGGD